MQIIDLTPDDETRIQVVANLLVEGFKRIAPNAWPNLEAALAEVQESLGEDRISRMAITETGNVLGWIGGIRQYMGNCWELHPLVVANSYQRQGIGRKLVEDLETQVRQRGGMTIYVGTDDEASLTSISDIDLFPNVLSHLLAIKNLQGHPYEFYQKVGFELVGIIPDANGFGKPDIIMAKRVQELA